MQYYAITYSDSYLQHHGIMGMKWGVRRFQDKAGRLTDAGRKRLGYSVERVKATAKDPEVQRKAKTAAKVAGAAAATGLAAYGAYKIGGPKLTQELLKRMPKATEGVAAVGKAVGKVDAIRQVANAASDLTRLTMPGSKGKNYNGAFGVAGAAGVIGAAIAGVKLGEAVMDRKAMSTGFDYVNKTSERKNTIPDPKPVPKDVPKSYQDKYGYKAEIKVDEKALNTKMNELNDSLFSKNQSALDEWMKKSGY